MPRAIADPEEIVKFSRELYEAMQQINLKRGQIQYLFASLRDHWQDVKYERFQEVFSTGMRKLDAFCQEGSEYATYLGRKAEILRKYLDHRY